MRVYGNLMNRLSEHTLSPTPELGMGATIYLWSDRIPATITHISPSGATLELTEDIVTGWKNFYGTDFAPNPNGRTFKATRRKGLWRSAGNGVSLGGRSAYRDPSF